MVATLATHRNAGKKKKNTGEYSPMDFRAAYVTAEVYDLLMHVPYWELSARSPTSSPCSAMPHTLLACWHLSSVLLESEVWVRPAQVGASVLHNLRVCLTFWHVMYLQNNVALFWHNLRLCWHMWRVSGSMSEKGVRCRVMAIHWYRPFWVPGSCVQTKTWCAGETLAMSLTWGYRWHIRLGVLFFAFNTYIYVIFSFIEVGESKFVRVQWKRSFPCAVHVSLLSVRAHVSCLITVFWMFANLTLGEYSIKT